MSREQKTYRAAYLLASFVVAAVLLVAGIRKILRPEDFALAVYRFHLLPGFLVNAAALYIPWLELVCAACLLLPRWRAAALRVALGLFGLFAVAIAINLWRGTPFDCGCFGDSPLAPPMNLLGVARNLALMALCALGIAADRRSRD